MNARSGASCVGGGANDWERGRMTAPNRRLKVTLNKQLEKTDMNAFGVIQAR
jgi:hypothetical protein